jgi:hypothetical protein
VRSRVRLGWRDEGGAVLPLLAGCLLVLLFIAAIAVDVSALRRRGQTLQNTADAAALAGVAVWAETSDQAATSAVVADIVRQNGVGIDDGVTITVVFPNPNEVIVDLIDPDPDIFIGGFIPGVQGDVARDASARLNFCENGCDKVVKIPRPFQPVNALGTGDGYLPIAIGDRMYAINHDDDRIACVDRDTETGCWTDKYSTPYGGTETDSVSHAVNIGTRIFWTAQELNRISLFCWDTFDEDTCPPIPLANLPDSGLGDHYRQRGGGTVEVGGDIYVFTDDHRVHCVVPPTGTPCPGYVAGGQLKTAGLATVLAPLDPDDKVSGSNIDRIVNGTQIFHTLHVRDSSEARAEYDTGVWLDCWDTATDNTCVGFTPYKLHTEGERQQGRLFFHRTLGKVIDGGGVPDAVCSTGLGDIQCTPLTGGVAADSFETEMATLQAAFPPGANYDAGMGVHMWHEPTNRLFLTTPRIFSTNHCWDFTTASYCGDIYGTANGNETQDYGFIAEGNCIFALGHTSIFWAFTTEMAAGCPGAFAFTRINKCECEDIMRWGNVKFQFDIGPNSPFTVLNIQVKDPSGAIVLPDDGSDWLSVVGNPTNVLDLSEIPTTFSWLDVTVYAEATSEEPWDSGDIPTIFFGFEEVPILVE